MGIQRSEPNTHTPTMKVAIVLLLAAVAYARPEGSAESAELLRSDVAHPDDDGAHSMSFAIDNGIDFELSGREGEAVPLTFVADENGFQPDSSLLPVAPAFPHEIPQFVLDQIAFAEQERAAQAEYSEEK